MILFFNVYLTNEAPKGHGTGFVNRENAKFSDKLDVFKYNLASLSKIYNWKKVIINCKLDEHFSKREEEFHNFVKAEFEGIDLHLRNYRNETQNQWKSDYALLDDNLIWFSCNHDHIFIDTNLEYFNSIIDKYKNIDEYFSIRVSHWQECISEASRFRALSSYNHFLHENYLTYNIPHLYSIQIISKQTYYHWWFDFNLPDKNWGRPDYFENYINQFAPIKHGLWIVPYREWCRHFDGYQQCLYPYDNTKVSVLEIPDGFFENNIKIYYGPNYRKGYTNIDPYSKTTKVTSETKCDLNIDEGSIPLFWLPRISEFINDYPEKELITKSIYKSRILSTLHDVGFELKNKIRKNY
jgi:hypothetical protein